MSVKRSRPGVSTVRKGRAVGPDYIEDRFTAPWNADISLGTFGEARDDKAILSEAATTFHAGGAPIESGKYDELWNGK